MSAGTNTVKRNNEDAMIQSGSVDNGAKKLKLEPAPPSKVVHLRSLPTDVSDREVIQLGMKFGKVANILMLKGKGQAFLEMQDEEVAQDMVRSSEVNPPSIRQRTIYIQFSNHKELKTDSSSNQQQVQALLEALQHSEGGENHVLRAVVENMAYPINVEVLRKIFIKYGSVLKVITFNKNNQFQALIQMANANQADAAKTALDGQNIYNNCCTLRIEFSKLHSLNVKYNNDKSFDFTRDDLPSGDRNSSSSILGNAGGGRGLMPAPYPHQNLISAALQQSQMPPFSHRGTGNSFGGPGVQPNLAALMAQLSGTAPMGASQNAVLHVNNLNEEMIEPQVLFTLFGVYGDVMRVKILFNKKDSALVQMADHSQAQTAMKHLQGICLFDKPIQVRISRHNQVQMPKDGHDSSNLTQDFTNSPLHRFKKPGSKNFQNIFSPSKVLHLSNIPEDITEDFLVDTFSKHGRVDDFKFFAKDRRMALIQLSSIDDAVNCLVNLHNYALSGSNHLRVSFSKGHINK